MEKSDGRTEEPPEKRRKPGRPRVHDKLVDQRATKSGDVKLTRKKRKRKRPGMRFSRVKNSQKKLPQIDESAKAKSGKASNDAEVKVDELQLRLQSENGESSKASYSQFIEAVTEKSDGSAENNARTSQSVAPSSEVKRELVGGDNPELLVYIGENIEVDYAEGLTMEEFECHHEVQFANPDIPFNVMYFEENKPFAGQQPMLPQVSSLDPLSVDHDHQALSDVGSGIGKQLRLKAAAKRSLPPKIISVSKLKLQGISEAIYKWYEAHFENGIPLTKFQILEKTKDLARCFFDRNVSSLYQARWFEMWQQHHNIYKPLFGTEREAPNESMASYYRKTFKRRMETQGLQTHQLFCAQIFYLNYKTLPGKPTCPDPMFTGKRGSDRVAVMACSNVDGTLKLPLLVVGKQPETTIFRNTSPYVRPVTYLQHKSALLNGRMLDWWFKAIFVELVKKFLIVNKLPVRALLLFERYKSFGQVKKISDGEIAVEYLDPEVTRALHPMELGIMDQIKKRYKMTFLKSVLCIQNFGVSMSDFLETITLRQALFQLKDAWDFVSNENIFKCWSRLLPEYFFHDVDTALANDITIQEFVDLMRKLKGYNMIGKNSVRSWIDSYEAPPPIPNFEALVEMVRNFNVEEWNVIPESELPISKPEAFYAVDTLLQFFQENLLVNPSEIDVLKKIKYAVMDYSILEPLNTAKT